MNYFHCQKLLHGEFIQILVLYDKYGLSLCEQWDEWATLK